ncbi:MAG: hypothetical protein LBP20_05305, partial [Treponema sp.]|nr:hypothetical protein [Treponema sp.]
NFGNKPVTEANGNGALRFAVAEPSSAASGELLVSKGSLAASSLTFTTAGYTGTAQAWYAAVPSGAAEPGYAAYTPLGDIAPGTHTNEVTLPGTNGYDVYVVLLKDGKAGAPHKVVFSGSVLRQESGTGDDEPDLDPNPGEGDPGGEEPLDPTPGKGDPDEFPFTSIEAVRKYIDNLIGSGDFRGNSVNNPILLPLAVNLDENNTEKILTLIAGKGNTLTWTCPSVPLPKTSLASYLFLTMTGWSP